MRQGADGLRVLVPAPSTGFRLPLLWSAVVPDGVAVGFRVLDVPFCSHTRRVSAVCRLSPIPLPVAPP